MQLQVYSEKSCGFAVILRILLTESLKHDRVVLAWGGGLKHSKSPWIADYTIRIYRDAVCLGTNGDGTPKHPLYIKYTTEPVPFTREAAA